MVRERDGLPRVFSDTICMNSNIKAAAAWQCVVLTQSPFKHFTFPLRQRDAMQTCPSQGVRTELHYSLTLEHISCSAVAMALAGALQRNT